MAVTGKRKKAEAKENAVKVKKVKSDIIKDETEEVVVTSPGGKVEVRLSIVYVTYLTYAHSPILHPYAG